MATINFNPINLMVVKAQNHISSPFFASSIDLVLLNVDYWDSRANFSYQRDILNQISLVMKDTLLLESRLDSATVDLQTLSVQGYQVASLYLLYVEEPQFTGVLDAKSRFMVQNYELTETEGPNLIFEQLSVN